MRQTHKEWLRDRIDRQRKWIDEHGGNIVGYVERYGSKDDENHFGDGGELIYAADMGELRKLERELLG